MKEFFLSQMDYIFFLYGFAFLILSVSCFFLTKSKNTKLPWSFLFLFSLSHGLNEWGEMLTISLGDSYFFNLARAALLALSYIFLLEFGRRALKDPLNVNMDAKIYLLIVPLSLLGFCAGLSGLQTTIRYFIGLTGGALSTYALFYFINKEGIKSHRPLFYLGISLGIYTFLTGAIGPRADFFPGSVINYDSFLDFFQVPVQLLRGLAAASMAFFLWMYISIFNKENCLPPRHQIPKMIAIALALILGWVLVNYLGDITHQNLHKINAIQVELVSTKLHDDMENIDNMARTISGSPYISLVLIKRNCSNKIKTNFVLDRYNKGMHSSACFVLDKSGIAVASSNRKEKDSFIGKSFKSMPYFKNGMKGKACHVFAVETPTGKRGYYSSYPLKNNKGKVLGLVVVKKDAAVLEEMFHGAADIFLTDSNGIIFLSSKPHFLFHTLGKLSAKTKKELSKPGIYAGQKILPPIIDKFPNQNDFISFEGEKHHVFKVPLNGGKWSFIFFAPVKEILFYRLVGIIIIILVASVLMISFIILNQIELSEIFQIEKLRSDLTYMMVHDIKNPLASMLSATELLEDKSIGELNKDQKEVVSLLKICERKLLNLSLNILDLKRFEENKYELNKTRFSASDLIKELEWISLAANKENKNLSFNIEKDLALSADQNVLARIIENLIGNALKHTKQNRDILLNIKKESGRILFEVIDHGEGIEREMLPHLFDYYATMKSQTLKTKFDTGLGLAFCKLAVEAHGGTIGVQSNVGEGSRFYFYLPE